MTAKQIGVNIREARLIEQWLKGSLANATWENLLDFLGKDAKVIEKVREKLNNSELYTTVGNEIEAEAIRLVKDVCSPEWNRISDEMRPLGEERNRLAKEKAELPEDGVWETEKEERLAEIDRKMAELNNDYQKVTDQANAQLNEFKENRISQEQGATFFLSEKDYKTIGKYAGF